MDDISALMGLLRADDSSFLCLKRSLPPRAAQLAEAADEWRGVGDLDRASEFFKDAITAATEDRCSKASLGALWTELALCLDSTRRARQVTMLRNKGSFDSSLSVESRGHHPRPRSYRPCRRQTRRAAATTRPRERRGPAGQCGYALRFPFL